MALGEDIWINDTILHYCRLPVGFYELEMIDATASPGCVVSMYCLLSLYILQMVAIVGRLVTILNEVTIYSNTEDISRP